ncbi:hypothetical protein C0389_02445 [bacterium]|nr:hypothetical protein [bacterium]
MKLPLLKYFSVIILFLIITSNIQGQTFGFGCLGLSGFYAGISQESYDASGINNFLYPIVAHQLNVSNQSSSPVKFEKGTGYRIGANLFRAKFNKVFVTAKGYYQFLKEEHSAKELISGSNNTTNHSLSLNHWGVGVDFGVNLFWILDWKVLEGNVTFFSADFTTEYLKDNVFVTDEKYNLDKTQIGYFVGSGLILHLVPDYLSLEGTVGFSFIKIESLKRVDSLGNLTYINNAVPSGGLNATIQLNVGFPL